MNEYGSNFFDFSEKELLGKNIAQGGVDFLHKPFSATALSQKLRQMLDKTGTIE